MVVTTFVAVSNLGRDQSILLLFSSIFLSGSSFFSDLLCSRFC